MEKQIEIYTTSSDLEIFKLKNIIEMFSRISVNVVQNIKENKVHYYLTVMESNALKAREILEKELMKATF